MERGWEDSRERSSTSLVKVQQVLKRVKSTCLFYLLVSDKLNTKNQLVVLKCLTDRAFNSTDCLHSFVIMSLLRLVVEC